jgi:ATP-dependent Clp protease ATP-binding subunit ClpC
MIPENLSFEGKQIFEQAKMEAKHLRQPYIGTEHLWIALTEDECGITYNLLRYFKFDPQEIRRHLRITAGMGGGQQPGEELKLTPRLERVFLVAGDEATRREADLIHEQDIILALLKEGESVPLQQIGLPVDEMMTELQKGEIQIFAESKRHNFETPFLNKFGRDLTALAREGKLNPVIGRDDEILHLVRILSRKTKSDPLLIGDPGVGKTALVEGLALLLTNGALPQNFPYKRIVELSMVSIVAGTQYRGEFEERMMGIIKESKQHPEVVLFLDEIHTLIGTGQAEGSLDACNFLKPALTRGEIRCIGATTIVEHHKYMEKDPALDRRFQPVIVEEPSIGGTIEILRRVSKKFEEHYGLEIDDSAIYDAVKLSIQYIPDRHLPDKALDALDEACAAVKIPKLRMGGEREKQDDQESHVTGEDVAEVISKWTGIPATHLTRQEKNRLLNMAGMIKQRVIGQNEAVDKICDTIKIAKAGLKDPKHPIGVFLLVGPSGVGKTELAKATAEFLFGSEKEIIRFDMSELIDKNSVSKLIGAAPGLIGYEEEGQLTGKLRRKPYSVVLLDEIEKAHPEIFDLFLQVFDEGRLTDSKGRTVDARNTIFIMTSNIGTDYSKNRHVGFLDTIEGNYSLKDEIPGQLKKVFRPEFLNRIDDVILFQPLDDKALRQITHNLLAGLVKMVNQQGIFLDVKEEVLDLICKYGRDPAYGARPLVRTIERLITRTISEQILTGEIAAGDRVSVSVQEDKIVFVKVEKKEKTRV